MATTAGAPLERPEILHTLGIDPRARRRVWLRRAAWIAPLIGLGVLAGDRVRRAFTPPVVSYETALVERHDVVVAVTASGTLEPWTTVDVSAEISGRVRAVHADYNDHVRKGQVLVELDVDLLTAQVAQASAQVELAAATSRQARTNLDEATLTRERTRSVTDGGGASRAELDAAVAAADRAAAALDAGVAQERSARATLTVARTNLAKATIRAPIDGVVLARSVDAGQTVVAALQAPVLLRLAENLDRMRLVVDVDEADIGRVAVDQAATFTVAAYPERTFLARVTSVRNAALARDNVVSYETVLDVDNREGLLRPGMTGTAQITARTEAAAVTVPNAALRFRPRGTATPEAAALAPARVWVVRDGRPAEVPVTVGVSDGSRTAVVDGDVAPGAAVIVGEHEQKR